MFSDMRIWKWLVTVFFGVAGKIILACPVCENQQPKITRGLTHGVGPQSYWDWMIIGVVALITLFTFIYSLKYLVKPGEKNAEHIKHSILKPKIS